MPPIAIDELHIGFTGSRDGMTYFQKQSVHRSLSLIKKRNKTTKLFFHHGDCIGADAQAHLIAAKLGFIIVVHPPTDNTRRAFMQGIVLPPKPFMDRNRDIVNESHLMIACPKTRQESLRSGTWATIRYSRNKGNLWNLIKPLV